ncbi:TPA: tail fiber domain-containing protein [Klebsiella quasipneumoniae subsp. quasipneumoniae]|nr:tail fiber domain-containing protein [Klebsiella quasipneumoniae subsp. quasipneumoniae]
MATISDALANSIQQCFDQVYTDLANQQQFLFGAGTVTITKPDGTKGTVKSWAQFQSDYAARQTTIDTNIAAANANQAKLNKAQTFTQGQVFSAAATFNSTVTVTGNFNGKQITGTHIELTNDTPYIDFHHGNTTTDYTHRIITEDGALAIYPALRVRGGLGVYGAATQYGDLYAQAFIARLSADPSVAIGDILGTPRFTSRFDVRGADSNVDGGQVGLWMEEQVGTNHRGVLMVGGFGANVEYWQFLTGGNIYGSTKGSVSFQGTSDARYKHDIAPTDGSESIARLKALELVTFVYNDDEQNRVRRGIIAQQAQNVDPQYVKQVVTSFDDGTGKHVAVDKLQLDNNVIMMDTLAVAKVLIGRVEALEAEIERLKAG